MNSQTLTELEGFFTLLSQQYPTLTLFLIALIAIGYLIIWGFLNHQMKGIKEHFAELRKSNEDNTKILKGTEDAMGDLGKGVEILIAKYEHTNQRIDDLRHYVDAKVESLR